MDKKLSRLEVASAALSSEITACLKKIDAGDSQSGIQSQLNRMISILGCNSSSQSSAVPLSNQVAHDRDRVMELYEGARSVTQYLGADEEVLTRLDISYEDLIAKEITSIQKAVELGITTPEDLKRILES